MTPPAHSRIFRANPNGMTDAFRGPLDLDDTFHEVAESVDLGWVHLAAVGHDLEQHLEAARRRTAPIMPMHAMDRSPVSWLSERAAIDMAADDPSTITSSVAQRHHERLAAELAREELSLVEKAQARLAERAGDWLTENEAALCAAIQTRRARAAKEISTLVDQLPNNVRSWKDIAGDPAALTTFQGIAQLLERWDALRSTHLAILGPRFDFGRWVHADWAESYDRSWTTWIADHVPPFDFRTFDNNGNPTGVDKVRQARAIASTRHWTPTGTELRTKINQLAADAPAAHNEALALAAAAEAEAKARRNGPPKPPLPWRVVAS